MILRTPVATPITMHISEGYRPGCIGRIAQLHASYYAASHGFGVAFEALVATELAAFCTAYRAGRDGLWLAADDPIQGSVALDGSQAAQHGAHLRWFITADAARGQGVGRALLARALALSDEQRYDKVVLWTFAGLDAARHLYESMGFVLEHQSPGARWGTPVQEQRFERRRP